MEMPRVADPLEPQLSDSDLVGRLRRGDRASFGAIVLRYEERVYAACRSILRDREEAIDVAQETFIQAFLSIGTLTEGGEEPQMLSGFTLGCPCPASAQILATRSKYSSSSFFPPQPFPRVFGLATNSMDLIHLTILYPS